jgi:hypothetical protein
VFTFSGVRRRHSALLVCLLAPLICCGPSPVGAPAADPSAVQSATRPLPGEAMSRLLRDLAVDAEVVLSASQPILLGKRNPQDPQRSEITLHKVSDVKRLPSWPKDANGGPGRKVAAMYMGPGRGTNPGEDFQWHQTRFRPALEMMRDQNRPVLAWANRFAERAKQLLDQLDGVSEWPEGLVSTSVGRSAHWPVACVRTLSGVVAKKDLARARRWAAETASTAFALADLHRWLDFLLENQLALLAFQSRCEGSFTQFDGLYGGKYRPLFHADRFPGGYLGLSYVSNYLEIERQAESLFQIRPDQVQVVRTAAAEDRDAMWLPPELREAFVQLKGKLSAPNQFVWARAARTPFERSYLTNMLFRSVQTKTVSRVGEVLQRLDKVTPNATVAEMMDVVFYRGGDAFAGFEWGDRFDNRLMTASGSLGGDNERAVADAQRVTFSAFAGWQNYLGFILTLREALDQRKFDCIRATDMIGSLYRNAGRSGFYNVRWACGSGGHTVGGAETMRNGKKEIVIVDGLESTPTGRDVWPGTYLRGYKWPTGFPLQQGAPQTVTLNTRGLDSYIWAEGCIVRGRDAGLLVRAGVPYLPGRTTPMITRATAPTDVRVTKVPTDVLGNTVSAVPTLSPNTTSTSTPALVVTRP